MLNRSPELDICMGRISPSVRPPSSWHQQIRNFVHSSAPVVLQGRYHNGHSSLRRRFVSSRTSITLSATLLRPLQLVPYGAIADWIAGT